MHRDLVSEADIQTAFKILHESHSLDSSLRKTADYSPKLNEMHPDQSLLIIDFVLSFINARPSLLFYNHAMRRHNRQQGLVDKSKKRVREVEDIFESLSVKEDSHGQVLQIEKRARSEVESTLSTLREKHMQLNRKCTDLEKLLAEANTRVDTAERGREKAVGDKKTALTKIQCPICYEKAIKKVTTCGHEFCRECYDKHFQISQGGDPDFEHLPYSMCRKRVFPEDSRSIHGLT